VTQIDPTTYLEIQQVSALFGHVLDNVEMDKLDQVWTDDGTFDLTNLGMWSATGFDALRGRLEGAPHAVTHHGTNLVVEAVDGDRATVRSKFVLVWDDGQVTRGEYHDVFARTPAGWRIHVRTVVPFEVWTPPAP
jgi:hypothetical protein